ncbi:ABC transporter B family member [Quillaja saponaria]|uniref:ABC transporter B family member n=1 Tax=Quillaja saponaria TaxID=32244 RepID=A0AAD7PJ39_QUISA|nr:ABC transporter B family member [Quillaja saponaria]
MPSISILGGLCGRCLIFKVQLLDCYRGKTLSRIKSLYLKNLLRQDIAFIDKEVRAGEVLASTSGGDDSIKRAMGKKNAETEFKAYAEADAILVETVGAIRTVVSLNGEKQSITKYDQILQNAHKAIVGNGCIAGAADGSILFTVHGSLAFAIRFGSKLILQKKYSAGDVIAVPEYSMNGSKYAPFLTLNVSWFFIMI